MIKNVECPHFKFPEHPVPLIVPNMVGLMMQERIGEMDVYVWKKDYELVHGQKAEFNKKEKREFPIFWISVCPH